jgi:hypothetical protein
MYIQEKEISKRYLFKKKNQLSIPSSLGVSIDDGHVPIFPNPNLQYLHHL